MQTTVRISDDKKKLAQQIADKKDRSARWVIDKAIENFARANNIIPLVCKTKRKED